MTEWGSLFKMSPKPVAFHPNFSLHLMSDKYLSRLQGGTDGLSNCIFIFSKQHICNHLLPIPIRSDDKTSVGWCFPPSRMGEGGNSTSYLGNVREKWRTSQCCTQPRAATEICTCSQGFKSKQSFLFPYPSYTREGGRRSFATGWWRKMSEASTQQWQKDEEGFQSLQE